MDMPTNALSDAHEHLIETIVAMTLTTARRNYTQSMSCLDT